HTHGASGRRITWPQFNSRHGRDGAWKVRKHPPHGTNHLHPPCMRIDKQLPKRAWRIGCWAILKFPSRPAVHDQRARASHGVWSSAGPDHALRYTRAALAALERIRPRLAVQVLL